MADRCIVDEGSADARIIRQELARRVDLQADARFWNWLSDGIIMSCEYRSWTNERLALQTAWV
jgi:hypothetical protein